MSSLPSVAKVQVLHHNHNQFAYIFMNAVFFETSAFTEHRPGYLDDENYRSLQAAMLENPSIYAVEGTEQTVILRSSIY